MSILVEKIWIVNRKQISQISRSFFFFLSIKPLALSPVFPCSLFYSSLIHSFLPPPSFIPSHTHPSSICAVKWDFRLHNVAWGFSFHIIPQADPKLFFSFSFFLSASHSLQPGARERDWEGEICCPIPAIGTENDHKTECVCPNPNCSLQQLCCLRPKLSLKYFWQNHS